MTISLTVMLIECTGDVTFGLPVVMVLIVAKWVGDLFNGGLYELQIQMMGIPLLPWEPPEMSYDITAQNVMNKPVAVFRTTETVDRIVQVSIKNIYSYTSTVYGVIRMHNSFIKLSNIPFSINIKKKNVRHFF